MKNVKMSRLGKKLIALAFVGGAFFGRVADEGVERCITAMTDDLAAQRAYHHILQREDCDTFLRFNNYELRPSNFHPDLYTWFYREGSPVQYDKLIEAEHQYNLLGMRAKKNFLK